MLIFSLHELKYNWYLPKKSKFSFYFILILKIQKAQPGCLSFDLTFLVCLLGITLDVYKVCT